MNSPDPVLNVKEPFTTVGAIMAAVNGVHLHLPTQEIFVLNSGGQSQDISGTIFDDLARNFYSRYYWEACLRETGPRFPSGRGDKIFDLKGDLNHAP